MKDNTGSARYCKRDFFKATKFIEIETIVIEIKYLISDLNSRLDIASERGSELKDRLEEIIRSAEKWCGWIEVKSRFRGWFRYRGKRWLWCLGQKWCQ